MRSGGVRCMCWEYCVWVVAVGEGMVVVVVGTIGITGLVPVERS